MSPLFFFFSATNFLRTNKKSFFSINYLRYFFDEDDVKRDIFISFETL